MFSNTLRFQNNSTFWKNVIECDKNWVFKKILIFRHISNRLYISKQILNSRNVFLIVLLQIKALRHSPKQPAITLVFERWELFQKIKLSIHTLGNRIFKKKAHLSFLNLHEMQSAAFATLSVHTVHYATLSRTTNSSDTAFALNFRVFSTPDKSCSLKFSVNFPPLPQLFSVPPSSISRIARELRVVFL